MMTDFERFISTLPEWDGKDRVSELEELVKAETIIFDKNKNNPTMPDSFEEFLRMNEDYRNYSDKWVNRVVYGAVYGAANIIFCGQQGIGKSTLIRWLFPCDRVKIWQETKFDRGLMTNGTSIGESEFLPDLSASYSGSLICYVGKIDYSYTQIDIKQLYAQVLAEQKE